MKKNEAPFLPVVFFFSGMSGLILQAVWMRMLIRVFGISIHATSTVVAAFMGGLALGSWAFGRFTLKRRFTLRLYAWVELGVAASAVLATVFIGVLPQIYAGLAASWGPREWGAWPAAATAARVALAAAALVPPTFLMGSTLPLLSRWATQKSSEVGGRLAGLYGLNTLGAVAGSLLAGFVMIALLGERSSVGVAVLINAAIGLFILSRPEAARPAGAEVESNEGGTVPDRRFILVLAGLSGFAALSYEIIWTRMLILLMGSSVYAFTAMLALYLLGIAAGSLAVMRLVDRTPSPLRLLCGLQVLLAVLGAFSLRVFQWTGLALSGVDYLYSPLNGAGDLFALFLSGAVIVLPVTFVLGMIFPVFGRILAGGVDTVGAAVGDLYAVNTIGGVAGSLLCGFLLIPSWGVQRSFEAMCGVNLLIGLAAAVRGGLFSDPRAKAWVPAGAAALLVLVPKNDAFLSIITNRLKALPGTSKILFHDEGSAGTLTAFDNERLKDILMINGVVVSGKGRAGTIMAHLPLLLRPDPKRGLVICFGVGNTFRAMVDHIGTVDAVELVEGVVRKFPVFQPGAPGYLQKPGVRVFINDGRNYLLGTREKYDAIVVDASPPIFSAGTVNLYSREFLELARKRLTEDGIMTLWVPLPAFESDFWMIARNFKDTFQHVRVWALPNYAGILLLGSAARMESTEEVIAPRMGRPGFEASAPWFDMKLFQEGFILKEKEIADAAARFPPVTDDRPRTEFPLGRFINNRKFWTRPLFLLRARGQAQGQL